MPKVPCAVSLSAMLLLTIPALAQDQDLDAGIRPDRLFESLTPQLPGPAAAGDVINSVPGVTAGSPLGITVVALGGNERIYVADLFNGSAEAYDLNLLALGVTVPSPGGTNTHTGGHRHPDRHRLGSGQ